jgi:hypothetical protein
VLDHAPPGARLVFSCGWHITLDGQDAYSWKLKALVNVAGPLANEGAGHFVWVEAPGAVRASLRRLTAN